MARRGNSSAGGCGLLIVVILAIGLVIMVIKWALITAAILAAPFGAWWVVDYSKRRHLTQKRDARAARRAEIEGRAVIDAAWGCGWCGSRIAHQDAGGTIIMPRKFHHEEIEQAIALED